MKTSFLLALGALAILSGCGVVAPTSQYPSALSNTAWEQRDCETWGGYWNRTALVCEWKD